MKKISLVLISFIMVFSIVPWHGLAEGDSDSVSIYDTNHPLNMLNENFDYPEEVQEELGVNIDVVSRDMTHIKYEITILETGEKEFVELEVEKGEIVAHVEDKEGYEYTIKQEDSGLTLSYEDEEYLLTQESSYGDEMTIQSYNWQTVRRANGMQSVKDWAAATYASVITGVIRGAVGGIPGKIISGGSAFVISLSGLYSALRTNVYYSRHEQRSTIYRRYVTFFYSEPQHTGSLLRYHAGPAQRIGIS